MVGEYHNTVMGEDGARREDPEQTRPYDGVPSQSDFRPPPQFSPGNPHFTSPYAPIAPPSTVLPAPSRNYYDPTKPEAQQAPDRRPSWHEAQTPQNREPYVYPPSSTEPPKYYNTNYTSPINTHLPPHSPITHGHPQRMPSISSQSPRPTTTTSPVLRHNGMNMGGGPQILYEPARQDSLAKQEPQPSLSMEYNQPNAAEINTHQTPSRASNPMDFSSILSNADPPAKAMPPANASKARKSAKKSALAIPAAEAMSRDSSRQSSLASNQTPTASRVPAKRKANGEPKPKSPPKQKPLNKEQEKEVQAHMAQIDADASDVEMGDFENDHETFKARSVKRKLEIEAGENVQSKHRRTEYTNQLSMKLGRHAEAGKMRHRELHIDEAVTSVQETEIQAEKERKKDMQRKRRREKTVAAQLEQVDAAKLKAEQAKDESERQRYIQQAERAEKKALQTKSILARGDKGPEIQNVSPVELNFAGGMLSAFAADPEPKVKSKKGTGNGRLRKSKEQKQAEKDSAIAAQAAIDAGEELAEPINSHEPRLRIKFNAKDQGEIRDNSPAVSTTEPFQSKGYNQVYEQIWRDIAKNKVPKVYKIAGDSLAIRQSNLKKTAILASKEAKRWQLRTNKGTKDLQARAKRVMREVMSFWKRNEREERDLRKAAEKQELENAKAAETERESSRQARKLNFLLSQTELYSHFIGKKIKTDEVERSTDDPNGPVAGESSGTCGLKLTNGTVAVGKVTDFNSIDFDEDDDAKLQAMAAANAQHAIAQAQAKAREFNNDHELSADGENFQNPSMGDITVEQPKMLQATLKEYQLKGLNWMANLYEQGINGILADEMGLGKTVQSISVMAYLAEKHDIWGPFLVVAPASTLHNWQQEIARFVPSLKVVPYWGDAKDRKILRKFWDRKHGTYGRDAPFHVLVTSYQLVVSDASYFGKMKWQYMILDEAQAIKSSSSSRWKTLLDFKCRNRLLLTGTPIQNNMQELWALLHFIMPQLFDNHEEFSEWFSKDIENHTQSNTKLDQGQLKRLHMILKPFMLRRIKSHVQKELGDKIEIDLFCDLTYRQRAYYGNLRNQISIMDLIEKATIGDDSDSGTLMNLVMQFRKVCNHPDLFERADISSPFSFGTFAEAGSFMREGHNVHVLYSTKNAIEYNLPRLVWREGGRLDVAGPENEKAGFKGRFLDQLLNVFSPEKVHEASNENSSFSWLKFADTSVDEISSASRKDVFARAVDCTKKTRRLGALNVVYDEEEDKDFTPVEAMLRIVDRQDRKPLAQVTNEGYLNKLYNVASTNWADSGMSRLEQCGRAAASAPPIEVFCSSRGSVIEKENVMFNVPMRRALYGPSSSDERAFIAAKVPLPLFPHPKMLPAPTSEKQRFTNIRVPSMQRFVTDSGKLAKLDELLVQLKAGGHRVLLYFQMTRMIDLMEEYLTYRNYKYLRLDGSTKLEDRRDTVHDFQTRPEIFIFLLSTRAGGLGINLTSADTVIFYDSDWNPTIDSQAMDRAHRLGQTRQVTVYRMITRGTIEERIRKRALQKEEVQKVVMTGGSGGDGVDFNTRSKENRTKDIAMWLVDDDEAAVLEQKAKEAAEAEAAMPEKEKKGKKVAAKKKKEVAGSLEDLYHEGEGHFDGESNRPSGTATPIDAGEGGKENKPARKSGGGAKKAKTAKQRLAMADGSV
ncbi:SNF2 family helicase/ATPase-like protein [Calycina marina]|uniref:Chromatin-remodeling ATPase INO80 n=1 Tax=Calycina marina TaxID=1763456 RepID=A0A9P7Z8U3_9HELO|nr:SNF2 family helicase/ATPase-like protein [Calycina marina]